LAEPHLQIVLDLLGSSDLATSSLHHRSPSFLPESCFL
jgi:hypothetical protein